jgi:hypothetical protein
MCTEECLRMTRRAAMFGAAAVTATAAATALTGEPARAAAPRIVAGRGLRDLTYPLTTSFPAFAPGEPADLRDH